MPVREVQVEVQMRRPLAHQLPIYQDASRVKIGCCGRRWGKTEMCLMCAIQGHGPVESNGKRRFRGAIDGGLIWWIAPTYAQANGVWAALKSACAPRGARDRANPGEIIWKSEVERTIHFPGGGAIVVKTADDPDNLRGYGLDGVIFDEAAFMKGETWSEVIRPALLDRGGWAFFISTPKGLNWYYDLFMEAEGRDNWMRIQRPTWDNPLISKEDIEDIRNDPNISPLTFQQEIEAMFVIAGAGMFQPDWFRYYYPENDGYVLAHGTESAFWQRDTLTKFTTVDLAVSLKTTADYTVISTWGVVPRTQDLLLLDCIRGRMDGPSIVPTLQGVYSKWQPGFIGIERSGYQLSVVQAAQAAGLPTKELVPSKDKVTRSLSAQARMGAGKVWFPRHQDWTRELEEEVLGFPIGPNDDFVDTLSYACDQIAKGEVEAPVAAVGVDRASPWNM